MTAVELRAGLAEAYEQACATPSDIYEHLPVMVALCEELRATRVIELGTRGGVSTIAWLFGLQDRGRLWSVDIDPAPELPYPHWSFTQGDDLDPKIVNGLPDSVDVVFVDTSHAFEQTMAELLVYHHKIRPGGCFLLHDTELQHPMDVPKLPAFPVKTAIKQFCFEEDLVWSNLRNCNGLGRIDIPG